MTAAARSWLGLGVQDAKVRGDGGGGDDDGGSSGDGSGDGGEVMMITMTKAFDRLRWTLMDDRGQADETCPKWHPKPRDKTRQRKGRSGQRNNK